MRDTEKTKRHRFKTLMKRLVTPRSDTAPSKSPDMVSTIHQANVFFNSINDYDYINEQRRLKEETEVLVKK